MKIAIQQGLVRPLRISAASENSLIGKYVYCLTIKAVYARALITGITRKKITLMYRVYNHVGKLVIRNDDIERRHIRELRPYRK